MTPTIMALADLVMPAATFPERNGIRVGDGPQRGEIINKVTQIGECKSDMEINLELGKRLNPEAWPWDTAEEMFTELLKPTGYTFEELREDAPVYLPVEYYKYKTGKMRKDGQPGFQTATGRIELWSTFYNAAELDPLPYFEVRQRVELGGVVERRPQLDAARGGLEARLAVLAHLAGLVLVVFDGQVHRRVLAQFLERVAGGLQQLGEHLFRGVPRPGFGVQALAQLQVDLHVRLAFADLGDLVDDLAALRAVAHADAVALGERGGRHDQVGQGHDGGRHEPVSYTHLDVYKRQMMLLMAMPAKSAVVGRLDTNAETTAVASMNMRTVAFALPFVRCMSENTIFAGTFVFSKADVRPNDAKICLLYTSRCV